MGLGWFDSTQAISTAVAAAGFAYMCLMISCPRCGTRWIWLAVSGKLGARSLDSLLTLDKCPKCGYRE